MLLRLDGQGPLYERIYRSLRESILAGELPAGTRLPSTRIVAAECGVSRNTVLLAYDQLLAEGYIRGQVGSGTYVSSELPEEIFSGPARALAPSAARRTATRLSVYGRRAVELGPRPAHPAEGVRYDFRYGLPETEGFPFYIWRKLTARRLLRPPQGSLTYGAPEGLPALRRALAAYLRRARAIDCAPERILIVNGSQQALDLVSRVLIDPGDRVLIEEPHYLGARQAFLAAGARLIAAPVDADGMDVEHAPPSAARARVAYVTPSHQFPTGAVMPLARRLALLNWAQATGAHVVEDDYDSEYRYGGRPVEAVQALDRNEQVIYVGTLSKTLFPALRLGYMVLPSQLVEAFRAAKFLADRHTPTLQQEVLSDFIGEGHFERHLRRTRTRNAERRNALLRALSKHCADRVEIQGSSTGLHLLLWLTGVPAGRLDPIVKRAAAAGVGVYPVAPNYLRPPRRAGLLLGYASLNETEIEEGIARLGQVLRD